MLLGSVLWGLMLGVGRQGTLVALQLSKCLLHVVSVYWTQQEVWDRDDLQS